MTNSWKNDCQNDLWGSLEGIFCNGKWIRTIFIWFQIVHGLVQPLLDKKSKGKLIAQHGRRPNIRATRLQEKHFVSSMYPRRGVCRAWGYKKRKNGKLTKKKTCNYCWKCEIFLCKDVLKVSTPRVRSENHWLTLDIFIIFEDFSMTASFQ